MDRQILKLRDYYQTILFILPRNESDGLLLLRILSQQQEIVEKVSWEEDKFTNLFDSTDKKKLIYIQLQSVRYYLPFIKKLEKDYRVKQFFNTDLSHIQRYLFTKLRIEPTSKVRVEYNGSKLLEITKIDDEEEVSPPPFSLLYFDIHTFSGILASDDAIRLIKVRYEDFEKNEREDILFQDSEERTILQDFSDYVTSKDPDIVVCMGDYDNRVLQYLFTRTKMVGFIFQDSEKPLNPLD